MFSHFPTALECLNNDLNITGTFFEVIFDQTQETTENYGIYNDNILRTCDSADNNSSTD